MRRKPYTERGIRRVPCVKCGAPSAHQWRICSTDAWSAVCNQCDYAINRIVAEWAFGQTAAAPILERYRQTFGAPDAHS